MNAYLESTVAQQETADAQKITEAPEQQATVNGNIQETRAETLAWILHCELHGYGSDDQEMALLYGELEQREQDAGRLPIN